MVFRRNSHKYSHHPSSAHRYNHHYNHSNYHYGHYENFSFIRNAPYTILLAIILVGCYVLQLLGIVSIEQVALNTQEVFEFNILTTFTSLFFHANLLHIIFNLIALLIFSRKVEQEIGFGTLFLFIFGGILANVIVSLYTGFIVEEHYLSIGASAGIASLIFFTIIARPISLLTPLAWFIILVDILNITNQNTTTNHAVHVTGYISSLLLISVISFKNKKFVFRAIIFNLLGLISLYFGLTYYGFII